MTSTETPEVAPSGFFELGGAIFHRPIAVGQAIAARVPTRAVVTALAVVLGVTLVCAVFTLPYLQKDQIAQLRRNPDMKEEQRDFAERFMVSAGGKALTILPQPIASGVGVALIALLLYLGQMVMGGRATFTSCFAVIAFAALISFGVGAVVRTVLVVTRESFLDVSTGLGVLVSDRPPNDPLRAALDMFDVFTLWAAVSAGIALAPPARLRPGSTLAVSLAVYFVLMGLGAAARVAFAR